jgi:5-methylcytosine-specific restriction endonuclease McrA
MKERIKWKEILNKVLLGEIKVNCTSGFKQSLLKSNLIKYECNSCDITEWKGIKISLELDHIDGDTHNNIRTNLRYLCPNCHSITDTYKGKNRKDLLKDKVVGPKKSAIGCKDDIIRLYKEGNNISQILKQLELNVGGNYLLIYKILKENNIEVLVKNDKAISQQDLIQQKTENRMNQLKTNINLMKDSNIDFNKSGWGKKVGYLLGMTPSSALKWVKREMPDFAKNCFKHSK